MTASIILLLGSGSHLASAQMVLSKQADWAAVDSTTLLYSKKFMQDGGKDILILETLGRLPPYPIVVNPKLPSEYLYQIAARNFLNSYKIKGIPFYKGTAPMGIGKL